MGVWKVGSNCDVKLTHQSIVIILVIKEKIAQLQVDSLYWLLITDC